MAEAKEDWKRGSFWLTPGLTVSSIAGLAAWTYMALDNVRDDLSAQILQTETRLSARIDSLEEDLDDAKDDLGAQILQTEARLNTRIGSLEEDLDDARNDLSTQILQTEARLNTGIGSLKEDIIENRNKIDTLETKVDRILGHLTGPEDGNGK